MKVFAKLRSILRSYQGKKARRKAHVRWVINDISSIKHSIINLSLRYGHNEISEKGYCRRSKHRAILLARRHRYLQRIEKYI